MITIEKLEQIYSNYNYFIFDVWGVIHDGVSAYPNASSVIKELNKIGKKVCFLSNAPRRASKVAEVLKKYDIYPNQYDFIMTSGEATFLDLQDNQNKNYNKYGKNYFYIGPKKDLDLLDGLDYKMVTKASEADFVINTGFDNDDSTIEEKIPQITEALKNKLKMICVNPDMIVIRKDRTEMLCAGVIAEEYKKNSGQVIYYGKPYEEVYNITRKLFNYCDKNQMIAIGDGLETDILGANNFGIDSVFITSGILSNKLGVSFGERPDQKKLKYYCELYKSDPKYVLTNL